MSRKLTNKQLAVLEELRRHRDGTTVQRVVDAIQGPIVTCPECGGTGEPQEVDHEQRRAWLQSMADAGYGDTGYPDRASQCGKCYGRGERRILRIDYGAVRQALERLVKEGLAERRRKLDEWGDPTQGVVYTPTEAPDLDDPLERLYQLPAAEGS